MRHCGNSKANARAGKRGGEAGARALAVLVTSAGNYREGDGPSGVPFAPANDPFVIGAIPVFDRWDSAYNSDASWDSASWADASWADASWADASWTDASRADASWAD